MTGMRYPSLFHDSADFLCVIISYKTAQSPRSCLWPALQVTLIRSTKEGVAAGVSISCFFTPPPELLISKSKWRELLLSGNVYQCRIKPLLWVRGSLCQKVVCN